MGKITAKAQIFFILIIILFLLIISVAVIFGGVLAKESIVQRAKIESIKADALTLSAINYAIYKLNDNPNFTTSTTTITLTEGSVDYSVTKSNATTSIVNIKAVSGKVIKNSQTQILFDDSEENIISVKFSY